MNMKDIAARAGVSSATVSRVINGSPLVRVDTADRIREILRETNFIPNPSATTLKYGRSKTYGLVIPDLRNPFFTEILAELEDLLAETDYELLIANSQTGTKLVKSVRRMLMRQVDGAIFMASEFDTKAIDPLFLHKVPLVTVDRRTVEAGCSDVAIDFESGYLSAVYHLRELGHSRLGYIGGTLGLLTSAVRLEAFVKAVKQAGMELHPQLIRIGDYRLTGGEQAIVSLMKEPSPPTAVLTANDLTAFGAIRGLHALGCSVPRDISIVGLDDVLLASVLQPPLTTIRIPRKRMAEACLKALNHTKQHVEALGTRYTVPAELVVRESTARIKTGRRAAK